MRTGSRWFVLAAGLVPLLAIGCKSTDTETTETPRVVVSGDRFALLTNTTVQLTATTVGGGDATYTWTSSKPEVASVSATGLVTGVTPGSATITATGDGSKLSGSYNVVIANEIPQVAAWAGSGHARADSEAFRHWDGEGSVSTSCARCHSSGGYRDYLGDDGSTAFKVDAAAALDTGVGCQACHNATAQTLAEVRFPSSVTLTGIGPEARCMTCHQGREAASTVDKAIANAGLAAADPDAVTTLSFKNVHYSAAGATLNGGRTRVGYEYAGKLYDWRFRHVPEKDSCVECHDPHTLKVDPASCAPCHAGVTTAADFHRIRYKASLAFDYDGDGNATEGIAGEIDGVREKLYEALQAYAAANDLSAICYNAHTHPYFLKDTDADGDCEDESGKYTQFTLRLLRATFNYQFSLKDAGAFAHNAKYVIELLFDSIEDLNAGIVAAGGTPIDTSAMHRTETGHFDGSGEAARHWDEDGDEGVEAGCAKCHAGSEGFNFFVKYGVATVVEEQGNGVDCMTCHTALPASEALPNLVSVGSVEFPSGAIVEPNETDPLGSRLTATSFICMTCHSGRESGSTQDADANIPPAQKLDPDGVSTAIKFRNVHYLPAGGVLLGAESGVGYEYAGKSYAGRDTHPFGIDCNACHDATGSSHTFHVAANLAACYGCHGIPQPTSVAQLRGSIFAPNTVDYDGDGNVTEPLGAELEGLSARLLLAMKTYAAAHGGAICYAEHAHPYWMKDSGVPSANGLCNEATDSDSSSSDGYKNWTPKLVRAAFNYQLAHKEPGAWAHNMTYIGQLLVDSIENLGGSTTGLGWRTPPTP